jgi:two-component system CheB/CheR fusion protein
MKKRSVGLKSSKRATNVGVRPPDVVATRDADFPIIGVGASAGGLEALTQFLDKVPEGSGMAFVVVQHLDPTHKGIMPELLQRATRMRVAQVRDRMKIQADSVYVIPPNRDMSILRGALHLFEPISPRGLRLPIDFFFRSLAEDRREQSVGVILSGMGTDGTLGLKAIKEAGGFILVQDPATAKFDGMPRSAVETGLVDVVAPAGELVKKLIYCLKHITKVQEAEPNLESRSQSGLEKAIILLRAHTGHDFSLYKKTTLYRRIERRMSIHQIGSIAHYVRYLQENPQERELLFKELLIGVTSFFRDPDAWKLLSEKIIPELLARRPGGGQIRVWAPGCSTGEEAYSLAMVFKEAMEQVRPDSSFDLQIFATDLDRDAIGRARQGLYPPNIAADVSAERLRRFFVKTSDGGYQLKKEIRETVTLAPQNVIMDPPFTKLDFLVCRNLLIYLAPELQKKLLPLFYYCLSPGGILFLGSAETVGGTNELFTSVDSKWRIYRRAESTTPVAALDFPSSFSRASRNVPLATASTRPHTDLASQANQVLLQQFAPAAVMVNDDGDIVYISGRTGKYLEPAAGKANWNIFAMVRDGLRNELTLALQKATRGKAPVIYRNLMVKTDGGQQSVDLTVQSIESPDALRGLRMVVFTDVAPSSLGKVRARSSPTSRGNHQLELERELQLLREELQCTHEEAQTSQEELKSANEELQSTNEELQSTNEELTTSKEELQSLNEELQTVNAEMQAKVEELSRASNDMKNLLNSTDIATVFLDSALRVRRFTSQAAKIINLISGDVGRPITDIASASIYPDLANDVEEVLRDLVPVERQVCAKSGDWYATRIIPYRTMDNVIDGVVMTFGDVTTMKKLETELRTARDAMETRADDRAKVLARTQDKLKAETHRRKRAERGMDRPAGGGAKS